MSFSLLNEKIHSPVSVTVLGKGTQDPRARIATMWLCFDKLYGHLHATRARKAKTVCGLMFTISLVETCSHISYYITHFVVSMTQLFCDLYNHHGIPKIKKYSFLRYFEIVMHLE